jgi:hypothetical protein
MRMLARERDRDWERDTKRQIEKQFSTVWCKEQF